MVELVLRHCYRGNCGNTNYADHIAPCESTPPLSAL